MDHEESESVIASDSELDITDYCQRLTDLSGSTVELLEPNAGKYEDSDSACTAIDAGLGQNYYSDAGGQAVSLSTTSPATLHFHHREDGGVKEDHPCSPCNFTITLGPVKSNKSHRGSSSTRLGAANDDIELDYLPLQTLGTYSTDNLIPRGHKEVDESESLFNDQRNNQPADTQDPASISNSKPQVPNYKPRSLQWPIQVLILATMAGMFAFLEYQIRDLPPLRYKALQFDTQKDKAVRALPSVAGITLHSANSEVPKITSTPIARSLPKPPIATPTITNTQTVGSPTRNTGRPTPSPIVTGRMMMIPRPPSQSYVDPKGPVTAYCGWGRPSWNLCTFAMNARPGGIMSRMHWVVGLEELIPVFTTTDPSWCACTLSNGPWPVDKRGAGQWDRYFPVDRIWETDDDGCRSVMNLVASLNYYKVHTWTPLPPDYPSERSAWQGAYMVYKEHNTVNLLSYYNNRNPCSPVKAEPSSISPFWPYPITKSTQDVLVPLEVRNPWLEGQDVFGNDIEHARDKPASFPVKFRWGLSGLDQRMQAMTDILPCTTDTQDYLGGVVVESSLVPHLATCSNTTSSHETVWWTLPYGKPTLPKSSSGPSTTTLATSTQTGSGGVESTNSSNTSRQISQSSVEATRWTEDTIDISSSTNTQDRVNSSSTASHEGGRTTLSEGQTALSEVQTSSSVSSDTLLVVPHSTPSAGLTESVSSVTVVITHSKQTSNQAFTGSSDQQHEETANPDNSSQDTGATRQTEPENLVVLGSTMSLKIQSTLRSNLENKTPSLSKQSTTTDSQEGLNIVFVSGSKLITTVTTPMRELPSASKGSYLAIIGHGSEGTIKTTHLVTVHQNTLSAAPVVTPAFTHSIHPTSLLPRPGPISPEVYDNFYNLRTEVDFLMVSLLPVLLATLVGIPVQIFMASVNSILPFRALGHNARVGRGGASAEDSLCLSQSTWLAPWISYRFIRRFSDPLPLLTVLLGAFSTILVPLSTETIRLEFTSTDCRLSKQTCAYGLRKVTTPIRAVEGLLVAMAVIVVMMGYILIRWRSGLATNPWSIASMAALLLNSDSEVRGLIGRIPRVSSAGTPKDLEASQIVTLLSSHRFQLGFHNPNKASNSENNPLSYGIHIVPPVEDNTPIKLTVWDPPVRTPKPSNFQRRKKRPFWSIMSMSTSAQQLTVQIVTLLFTIGLLILVLYYENTILPDTAFEKFMDSQSFGVRILFTVFGTILGGLWNYHFSQITETHTYHRLSRTPQPAQSSILLSPPSNIFLGIWRFTRMKDILPSNVALATLLAKFTPILLSNIPFRNTVTWKMHEWCTWLAVGVLGYMVLVLGASLLLRGLLCMRKRRGVLFMPVRADSIVGCMYYLVESGEMLSDLGGLDPMIGGKRRDRLVVGMGRRYRLGVLEGGIRRGGVPVGATGTSGTADAGKEAVGQRDRGVGVDYCY